MLGFSKALSDEVAADGITVNVLCPGLFETDRLRELADRMPVRLEVTKSAGSSRVERVDT